MTQKLNLQQLTGREESHLVDLPCGHRLQPAAARAFRLLQEDAREEMNARLLDFLSRQAGRG